MIKVKQAIDERINLAGIISLARKKMIPMHKHSIWYYMGGMILSLFMIQMITGSALLFYYKPTAETAYQSVAEIMVNVPFGWLIRSVHHWASNLMIVLVFVHFFSTFLLKAYRRPRELNWLTGMVMLLLVQLLGYSGYTLPFDERSFFALNVGTDLPAALPVVGHYVLTFLRGGETVGPHTLNRFFALHVGVLPLALIVVLAVHIILVQFHGMSIPPSVEKEAKAKKQTVPGKPMFPHLFWHSIINGLLLLGILVTLAVCLPAELSSRIDYLNPPPEVGNVKVEKCIICHPSDDPGKCSLANYHEEYCFQCHTECVEDTTTTTAAAEQTAIVPPSQHIDICSECHYVDDIHAQEEHDECTQCHDATPEGVKSGWFFLWVYQILKLMPTYVLGLEGEVVGITGLALIAVLITFAPFIDRKSQRSELSPVFTVFGFLSLIVFLLCSVIGYFS